MRGDRESPGTPNAERSACASVSGAGGGGCCWGAGGLLRCGGRGGARRTCTRACPVRRDRARPQPAATRPHRRDYGVRGTLGCVLACLSCEREDERVDQSAASGDDILADARSAFERCDWVAAFEVYRAGDSAASLELDDLERGGVRQRSGSARRTPVSSSVSVCSLIASPATKNRRWLGHRSGLRSWQDATGYAVALGWLGLARSGYSKGANPARNWADWSRCEQWKPSRSTHDATGRGPVVRRSAADRSADSRRGIWSRGHWLVRARRWCASAVWATGCAWSTRR